MFSLSSLLLNVTNALAVTIKQSIDNDQKVKTIDCVLNLREFAHDQFKFRATVRKAFLQPLKRGDTHGAAPAAMDEMTMRKMTLLVALAAATALSTPAMAGSPDGKIQVKVLGTAVLADGDIDSIKSVDTGTTLGGVLAGLDAGSYNTDANNNVVPTIAVEYFINKVVSVETICCLTQHHVSGTGALEGAGLVDHVMILPATVTVKAHLDTGTPIKPYIGAGPSIFFVIDEKPGATAAALGIDKVKMSNSFGVALQGGVDIALGESGFGLTLDAKKYFVKPTAKFYEDGTLALETKHNLDPWVLSAGVSYRF